MKALRGQFAVVPMGTDTGADTAFRYRSVSGARKQARRLSDWSGGFVYIVDQDAVERGETRPYYAEIVAPPGKSPWDWNRP